MQENGRDKDTRKKKRKSIKEKSHKETKKRRKIWCIKRNTNRDVSFLNVKLASFTTINLGKKC